MGNVNIKEMIKTEQFRGNVIYVLMLISIVFFLVSGQISRNAFYILTYISIISFIFLVVKSDKKIYFYWIPTLFLILGLTKWIWASVTVNHQLPLIAEHYRISGKRMILGAFLLYIIHRLSPQWEFSSRLVKSGTILLCLMLLVIVVLNVQFALATHQRPKINSDAATSGAYMFTLMALVTLWSIRHVLSRHYIIPLTLIATCAFILLGVSGTRSAIILFSLICLMGMIHHIIIANWKTRIIGLTALLLVVLSGIFFAGKYSEDLLARVDSVKTEITQYQNGHPSTSIGGRIGMWQAGLWAFTQHPWGQSADSRNTEAKTWITHNQPQNLIALWNIQFHTHNDLVESFSLQGIVGGVVMLALFISLLVAPFSGKARRYELLLLAIPVIYFSMGDSQFYNRESPYFIMLIWGYFFMMRHAKTSLEISQNARRP